MNTDDSNISRLMEMGFSREDAIEALRQSSNDLEKAISYLFGDHTFVDDDDERIVGDNFPPLEPSEDNQLVPYGDSVDVRNPEDIPNIAQLQRFNKAPLPVPSGPSHAHAHVPPPPPPPPPPPSSHHDPHPKIDTYSSTILNNKKQFIEDIDTNSADNFDIQSPVNEDDDDDDDDDSIYDKVQNYARIDNFPPVILNQMAGYLENYIIPLLVILSQYDKFKDLFLNEKYCHFNYGYSKQWFQHESDLSVLIPEEFKQPSDLTLSYRFVVEIQRLFAFLLPQYSKRSYMSGQLFLSNLPLELNFEINNDRINDLEELIKKFYTILNVEYLKIIKSESNDEQFIDKLFKSTIESIQEEDSTNDIFVIPIEYEARSHNLFSTLSSMFWNDDINDDEAIGNVRFDDISPVITIQLSGDEDGFQTQPFAVDEYFYPEIFSSKYVSIVREMNFKKKQIIKQRNSLTQSIMNFNSFEGKPIKKIMNHSLEFLKTIDSQDDIVEDLTNLTNTIRQSTSELTSELHSLSSKNLQYDIKNIDQILKYIESVENKEMPKRYMLTGVIASDTEYFYKTKIAQSSENKDQQSVVYDWVHVTCFITNDKKVVDFSIDYIEFSSVQQAIHQFSKDSRRQFIFVYVEEESFNEDYEFKLSTELESFFKEDNENLEQSLRLNKFFNNQDDDDDEEDDEEGKGGEAGQIQLQTEKEQEGPEEAEPKDADLIDLGPDKEDKENVPEMASSVHRAANEHDDSNENNNENENEATEI